MSTVPTSSMSQNKVAFSSDEFRSFKLAHIEQVSHDTKMFRVALPSEEHEMGMITASCLMLQGADADTVRPYTPTTLNSQVCSASLAATISLHLSSIAACTLLDFRMYL
jgi:Oxidoreductase FAD-binding domain